MSFLGGLCQQKKLGKKEGAETSMAKRCGQQSTKIWSLIPHSGREMFSLTWRAGMTQVTRMASGIL